jgi:hypothetical protein
MIFLVEIKLKDDSSINENLIDIAVVAVDIFQGLTHFIK